MSVGVAAPRRTRDRILDVALDLFAAHGFAGTAIAAIEREVGLAAGTGSFHRHFRSKEELLHAAVEREVEHLLAEIDSARAALPPVEEPSEKLMQDLTQTLSDIRRFDRLFRLMLTEGDRLPELRATFAKAIGLDAPGPWAEDTDTVIAVAALAGYHYLGLMQGRHFQSIQPSDFVAAVVRVIRG